MPDDLKIKYLNLKQKMDQIKECLDNINYKQNELKHLSGDTILVDNRICDEDNFNSLKNDNNMIINEINSVILPMINNKL